MSSGERLILGILVFLATILVVGALSGHFVIAFAIVAAAIILPWLIWGIGLAWRSLSSHAMRWSSR